MIVLMKKSQLSHAIRSVSPLGAARGMSVRQEPTLNEKTKQKNLKNLNFFFFFLFVGNIKALMTCADCPEAKNFGCYIHFKNIFDKRLVRAIKNEDFLFHCGSLYQFVV